MCDACSLQDLDSEALTEDSAAVSDFLQVIQSYNQLADDGSDDDSESGVQYELRLDSLPFFQRFM